jgi:hypothetical protein
MIRLFTSAMMLSVLSLAGAGVASAQTGPSGGSTPTVNPLVNPAPVPMTGISETELADYLRTLDPNLKVQKNDKGTTFYTVVIRRPDGWSYSLMVESQKGCIWLNMNLGKLPVAPEQIQASLLAGLLQANFKYGPTHFAFEKYSNGGHGLTLSYCLDRMVSLDRVKGTLERLLAQVKESYPLWKPIVNPTA